MEDRGETYNRWQKLKNIFSEALELKDDEREAYIEKSCGGDEKLKEEVLSLLAAHDTQGAIDNSPEQLIKASISHYKPGEKEGEQIGPYKITETLGHGGMGSVYLAKRSDGQFEQEVALKLLQAGFTSELQKHRFIAERQILASLNHENIARLLDGGIIGNGQPWFAMEYVEGRPIDKHCDANQLTINQRLKLFLKVCDAVQFAHRKLIIHRDLKPSNILVTKGGKLKLLDFGIAKALNPGDGATESGTKTRTGLLPLTPAYASPEQIRSEAVTAASDIYQLGVILYKLLTGCRPYEVSGKTPGEMEQIICEKQPVRPGTAVTKLLPELNDKENAPREISQARQTKPDKLRKHLQGDLDTIVLKALRKEPDRRYDSVGQMTADIRNYLSGRPVMAHPDSMGYRVRKFIGRHKTGVASIAFIILLLICYGVTITWYSQRTRAALDRAQQESRKSEQVIDFLVGMFEGADPYQATGPTAGLGDTLTTRELLDQGTERARQELSDQPRVQARMMYTLGRIYRQLGYHKDAASLLDDALAMQQDHLPPTHPDRAKSLHERALILRYEGQMHKAARLYREALSIQRSHWGEKHPDIADNIRELGIIAARQGRYTQADSLFRKALAMRKSLHGPDHPDVALELHVLGLLYVLKGDLTEAERLLRRSLTIRRRHVDGDHPLLAETLDRLGQVLVKQGDLDEAEPLLRKARAIREELFPELHPSRAAGLNNLGRLLRKKGDYAAADSLHQKALSIYQQLYGATNLDAANTLYERAQVHRSKGNYATAEQLYKQAEAMQRSLHGPGHPSTQQSFKALTALYQAWGKYDKADSMQAETTKK